MGTNTGYVKLPANDAKALETAVAAKGPIAITAAAEPWMLYGGGVFEGCTGASGADLDHGIQVVGYTPTYWIVRTAGVQHGVRRDTFTFPARTTTQQRLIRHLRMGSRANHIRKRRPSRANVESFQIPHILLD